MAVLSLPGRALGTLEIKRGKSAVRLNLNTVCGFRVTEKASESTQLLSTARALEMASYLMGD